VKFDDPIQQLVLQEYIDTVREGQARVAGLEAQMRQALESWSLRPIVEGLMALRGVDVITAMTVLAELGDITRFDSPRQLMAFLGLVPSEHSSGGQRRQGAITKTGNGHVRRVLVEAAWSYRFAARKTAHLRRKAAAAPQQVQAIAWAAQKRLCARYWHLYHAGKPKPQVCAAIARELVGFIWAIACELTGKAHGSRRGGRRELSAQGAPQHRQQPRRQRSRFGSGRAKPVRRTLEAPMMGSAACRPTHACRARQLRDEVKSGR
jgi:hypothetical protein